MKRVNNLLRLFLLALFAVGSSNLLADSDDDHGGGQGGGHGGGGGNSRDALTSDFAPIPPTAGRGDGQYFELSGKIDTVLNADVRLALEKLNEDGDTLKILNTHLGITVDNYQDAVITLFIGTDEDGDGTCLQEGPTSICVLETGGSDDLEVNSDGILHAAWAMALREEEDGHLIGSGICWSDFDSVAVIPQFDDEDNMTSVVFVVEGGEEAMPEIEEDDGTMVGFGAPWLGFDDIECEGDGTCEIIPIMMGQWDD
jgi:hypothetical protein